MSDYLQEEVMLEILQRLPVKSLIRFRCVSKSWNSLIASSVFINSHLTRSLSLPSNSNKLIVRHYVDDSYVDYYKLIDDIGLFSLYDQERYILWNPSIRKFFTLPKPCITVKTQGSPMKCRQAFGFEPRTNDYKVVSIAFPIRKNMSEEAKLPVKSLIEVYSFNEGCWRITSASFPPGINFTDWRHPATSLNGAVHFAAGYEYKPGGPCGPLVLSFDLRDEVFHVISLPNGIFERTKSVHTSVIGDRFLYYFIVVGMQTTGVVPFG